MQLEIGTSRPRFGGYCKTSSVCQSLPIHRIWWCHAFSVFPVRRWDSSLAKCWCSILWKRPGIQSPGWFLRNENAPRVHPTRKSWTRCWMPVWRFQRSKFLAKYIAPNLLFIPRFRKKLTTAQYIYQALFLEEKSADITVSARGKLWRLHKVYLCQSPYFASMFGGHWRETHKDFIDIDVVDPRITKECKLAAGFLPDHVCLTVASFFAALFTVFGSLYLDEVSLEPMDIISTLATATLFQLDGLIERCAEVMNESMNAEVRLHCVNLLANTVSSRWPRSHQLAFIYARVSARNNRDVFVLRNCAEASRQVNRNHFCGYINCCLSVVAYV